MTYKTFDEYFASLGRDDIKGGACGMLEAAFLAGMAQRAEGGEQGEEIQLIAAIVVQDGHASVICPEIRLLPDGQYPLKVFTAPGKPSPFRRI